MEEWEVDGDVSAEVEEEGEGRGGGRIRMIVGNEEKVVEQKNRQFLKEAEGRRWE